MINVIIDKIADFYYYLVCLINLIRGWTVFKRPFDFKNIPIIINNRNRYTFLKKLVDRLHAGGYNNIVILDNASTYQPLLEYYSHVNARVIKLGKNMGFDALDQIALYKEIKSKYFVYTDSDVLPIEECPDNFIEYFHSILQKYPLVQKVGFSLKIDDLPSWYNKKADVIAWESSFWEDELEPDLYKAKIDTTFALHRPFAKISTKGRFDMIRTGYPYVARHLPWYVDSSNLTLEEQYYNGSVEIGTQWSKGIRVQNISFFRRMFFRRS
jgi:hypothetical protein